MKINQSNKISFGTSVLVVPLTEFSVLAKLNKVNKDNLEVKNEKWIAGTKSITADT